MLTIEREGMGSLVTRWLRKIRNRRETHQLNEPVWKIRQPRHQRWH